MMSKQYPLQIVPRVLHLQWSPIYMLQVTDCSIMIMYTQGFIQGGGRGGGGEMQILHSPGFPALQTAKCKNTQIRIHIAIDKQ